VLFTAQSRRVPGVFVVLANRLDKRDRRQGPVVEAGEEIGLTSLRCSALAGVPSANCSKSLYKIAVLSEYTATNS
jgi:hypothetical protein